MKMGKEACENIGHIDEFEATSPIIVEGSYETEEKRQKTEQRDNEEHNNLWKNKYDREQSAVDQAKPALWKRIVGFGLMITIFKNIINGFSDLIVKKIVGINPVTLVFFRSIISLSIAMPLAIVKDQPPFPENQSVKDRVLLVTRCVIGCLHVSISYFALQQMPLSVQKIILSTRPVFTIIFARIFLKESCGLVECVSIVLMMAGIVLVIKPPFLFQQVMDVGYKEWFLLSSILLFISNAIQSNVSIILRHLRKQSVVSLNSSREIIYVIMTFLIIFCVGLEMFTPSWEVRLKILVLGVSCSITSAMNIIALKLEEAGKIALLDRSSAIIIALVIQTTVFHEIPDSLSWVGMLLVLGAVILTGVYKVWMAKKSRDVLSKS